MKQTITAFFLFAMLPGGLVAQTKLSFASQTLHLHLGDVIDIEFIANRHNVGTQLHMSFTSSDDYFNGIESERQFLQVHSSKNFTVSVRAINVTAGSNQTLPSFIYLKVPDNRTGGTISPSFSDQIYQPLQPIDRALLENGQKGANQIFSVQYKARPGTLVEPGIYSIDIIFTASRS